MNVIASLKEERAKLQSDLNKIDAAIRILGGQESPLMNGASRPKTSGGHISAAGRKRLSALMKRRWAERRKAKPVGNRAAAR